MCALRVCMYVCTAHLPSTGPIGYRSNIHTLTFNIQIKLLREIWSLYQFYHLRSYYFSTRANVVVIGVFGCSQVVCRPYKTITYICTICTFFFYRSCIMIWIEENVDPLVMGCIVYCFWNSKTLCTLYYANSTAIGAPLYWI